MNCWAWDVTTAPQQPTARISHSARFNMIYLQAAWIVVEPCHAANFPRYRGGILLENEVV
jgi:hypothetical protein